MKKVLLLGLAVTSLLLAKDIDVSKEFSTGIDTVSVDDTINFSNGMKMVVGQYNNFPIVGSYTREYALMFVDTISVLTYRAKKTMPIQWVDWFYFNGKFVQKPYTIDRVNNLQDTIDDNFDVQHFPKVMGIDTVTYYSRENMKNGEIPTDTIPVHFLRSAYRNNNNFTETENAQGYNDFVYTRLKDSTFSLRLQLTPLESSISSPMDNNRWDQYKMEWAVDTKGDGYFPVPIKTKKVIDVSVPLATGSFTLELDSTYEFSNGVIVGFDKPDSLVQRDSVINLVFLDTIATMYQKNWATAPPEQRYSYGWGYLEISNNWDRYCYGEDPYTFEVVRANRFYMNPIIIGTVEGQNAIRIEVVSFDSTTQTCKAKWEVSYGVDILAFKSDPVVSINTSAINNVKTSVVVKDNTLYLNGLSGNKTISLFTPSGKLVKQWETLSSTVRADGVVSGVYLMKVNTDNYSSSLKIVLK